MVVDEQLFSACNLVQGRLPIHVKDPIPGAHEVLRLPMAIDAPIHLERLRSPNESHLIDPTMAGRATNALCDMNAVIEIDEIGQLMNSDPMQRFVLPKADEDRRQDLLVLEYLGVTGHAG